MDDPLNQIEDSVAQRDLGVVAFRIYEGARSEGASKKDAARMVSAFFRAVAAAGLQEGELE